MQHRFSEYDYIYICIKAPTLIPAAQWQCVCVMIETIGIQRRVEPKVSILVARRP